MTGSDFENTLIYNLPLMTKNLAFLRPSSSCIGSQERSPSHSKNTKHRMCWKNITLELMTEDY